MQAKLGAGFLVLALLYALVGLIVPRLGLGGVAGPFVIALGYVALALGAAWWFSRLHRRRLRKLVDAAVRLSGGDLTVRVERGGTDETAELAEALAGMADSLLNVVLEVQATAERIASSAQGLSQVSSEIDESTEGIAGTTRQIARGVEEQAGQVLRTSETTRGLAQAVELVASRARDVHEAASAAADRAARGAEAARRAADGIATLTQKTTSATVVVEGFRQKAGEIGSIVSFITSISHQTHLLAINAAIEAARAGQEGRGFGVVAEEVGRLADNVRRFAEQISTISDEIVLGAQEVADQIRSSVGAAEQVRDVVDRSAQSFEGILEAIRGTASRVGEISRLSEQQRAAADVVAESLEEISNIAGRNVEGTERAYSATYEQTVAMHRMAESARELARTSDQLRELIAVFKLR